MIKFAYDGCRTFLAEINQEGHINHEQFYTSSIRCLSPNAMSTVTLVLLLAAVTSVSLYALVASQTQAPAPYVLRVEREEPSSQGALVDLITLRCVESTSDQVMRPQDVIFWLNRERPEDPDFKDEDYVEIDNGREGIVFQLRVEGYYTCGRRADIANVEESERVPLIGE